MEFVPIDIVGVIASQVGEPRRDTTAGGRDLYGVPIQLTRSLDYEEVALLTALWDKAPDATARHRPGTARIFGDTFTLIETTIDEIAAVHGRTLRQVVDAFNIKMPVEQARRKAEADAAEAAAAAHRRHVEAVAAELRFE